MGRSLTLVLGGVRAGKSALALELGKKGSNVLFVATAQPGDAEMAARIAAHRASRPPGWDTLEEPLDLPGALARASRGYDTIVVDCLTLWVSNLLLGQEEGRGWEEGGSPQQDGQDPMQEAQRLLEAYGQSSAAWIMVSNEVGLGVAPATPLGRHFRDVLGSVNQLVVAQADKVYLVVAGLALEMKGLGAVPWAQLAERATGSSGRHGRNRRRTDKALPEA